MTDETAAADEIEINLRAPREVADRALILGAVCRRAFLEQRPSDPIDGDLEAERFDLAAWLRDEGLDTAATPDERTLLHTRVGRLHPDLAAAASWQSEALVALGWALGLLDAMPPYDAPADPAPLLSQLPAPWDRTAPFRHAASLPDEETVAAERERAELWHWRAGIADLFAATPPSERAPLSAAIRDVARDARNAGTLPDLSRDDFPARGLPYRDLAPESLPDLAAIAAERLRALNWLCGFGPTWDTVPLDL